MLTTRFSALAAIAALCSTPIAAHAADLVTPSVSVAPSTVAAGGHGTLTITLTIASGAHVNAHKLPSQDFIATNFTAVGAAGIKYAPAKYPAGHNITTAGLKQSVYEGTAKIVIPFTVAKTARKGSVQVGGSLTYQACNTAVCFPPKTVALQAPVTIK